MSQITMKTVPEVVVQVAAEVEKYLADRLSRLSWPDNLLSAVTYATLGGGKRIRPVLVVLSCEAVGGTRASALPAAAALELVHNFSLVHDDLPAMDDDDLRRGRPTLHRHAGEAMAILAGDAMLSLAFELIGDAERDGAAAPDRIGRLTAELAEATSAMIAGQVYDTLGGLPAGGTDRQRLELIHRNKTGALIRGACRMGGICGGADDAALAALSRYGEDIGLVFQIVDDLLDVTQSAEHIGKATGKDQSAGKLTFPGLLGKERSEKEVARLTRDAMEALKPLGHRAGPLSDVCTHMAVRTR